MDQKGVRYKKRNRERSLQPTVALWFLAAAAGVGTCNTSEVPEEIRKGGQRLQS